MAKLLFYRQKRVDRRIRTGLEWNDQTLAERFDDGPGERDPVLLWYVDVKCEGPGIPEDPDLAEQWFVDHSEILRNSLGSYAEQLGPGIDMGMHSLTWNLAPETSENVQVTIACSAADRITARELPSIMKDLAVQWDGIMNYIELMERAES